MRNKTFINLKNKCNAYDIYRKYDLAAREFQRKYNREHPSDHIWRHMLCCRTILFFLDGKTVSVTLEIVRFIHANTRKTFTFRGGLLIPYSCYSISFMKYAVSDPDSPRIIQEVTLVTIRRWASILRTCTPAENNCTHHGADTSRQT